jgi:RNA polymerase sigma-70 factor (ECF subfamily)
MADLGIVKQLTDEELVEKSQDNASYFFEELVHRYSHRLFHYFKIKISLDQDVEDLVQETFIKVYRNLHRFNFKFKFSTWIYTIANRLAISYYRKRRDIDSDVEILSTEDNPLDTMIQEEQQNNIWDVARRLKQNQYDALWLRYVESLSAREIALVMKKSQIHVRVLLHRARMNLIKLITQTNLSVEGREMVPAEKKFSFL